MSNGDDVVEIGAPPTNFQATFTLTRGNTRALLAFCLVFLLLLEIIMAYVAYLVGHPVNEIKEILLEVLGPTAALVGSAVGFYFGNEKD